jgi:hypothetical protein
LVLVSDDLLDSVLVSDLLDSLDVDVDADESLSFAALVVDVSLESFEAFAVDSPFLPSLP